MNDVDKDTNTSMIRKGCSVNHLLTMVLIPDSEKAPRKCYVNFLLLPGSNVYKFYVYIMAATI